MVSPGSVWLGNCEQWAVQPTNIARWTVGGGGHCGTSRTCCACSGAVVQWCSGAYRCSGAVVPTGAVVQWCLPVHLHDIGCIIQETNILCIANKKRVYFLNDTHKLVHRCASNRTANIIFLIT